MQPTCAQEFRYPIWRPPTLKHRVLSSSQVPFTTPHPPPNTQLRRLTQVYDTIDIMQMDCKRREGDCELIVRVRMQSHTYGRLSKGMYNMDIVHPIGTIGGCSAGRYYLTDS